MKKLKFIKPMLAATLAVTPTLSLLTSCSQVNYSEIASTIKDDLISNFRALSAQNHRETFDCQQIFDYIVKVMDEIGIYPAGLDKWATLPCVENQANIDLFVPDDPDAIEDWEQGRHFKNKGGEINYGNVWFDIPASDGYKDRPGIIIHAHMDMTMDWAKDKSESQDAAYAKWFLADGSTDPVVKVEDIDPDNAEIISDGNTSLGADNGIGVALMLSLAKFRNDFKHGPIRLLFSADESGSVPYQFKNGDKIENRILASGMDLLTFDQNDGTFTYYDKEDNDNKTVEVFDPDTYVKPFDYKDPDSGDTIPFFFKNIFSLDGSEQNTIYKSAAGIHQCQILKQIDTNETSTDPDQRTGLGFLDAANEESWKAAGLNLCTLTVEGLTGGHSAYNISANLGNALQLLMRSLSTSDPHFGLVAVSSSANAFNIAQSAYATFVVSEAGAESFKGRIETFNEMFKSMYPYEKNLNVKLDVKEKPDSFPISYLERKISTEICSFSNTLEYGPMTYFETGEVKSSLNFGPLSIKYVPESGPKPAYFDFSFDIVSRSADNNELEIFQDQIHNAVDDILEFVDPDNEKELAHIEDVVWEWNPDESHPLLKEAIAGFKNLGVTPKQANSHAWLEVACLPPIFEAEEKEKPDMVVSGPYITNGHTVKETCWSDTIDPVIKALLYTVQFYRG